MKENVWEVPCGTGIDCEYPTIPENVFLEWRNLHWKNQRLFPVRVSKTKYVMRTCEEMAPFGPWRVIRFSYKNKKYSSLLDDIYCYATIMRAQEYENAY